MRPNARALALFMLPLVAAACGVTGDDDPQACSASGNDANLDGTWALQGSGELSGCTDPQLDGSFAMSSPSALAVQQIVAPSGPDGLQLAAPAGGPLTLDGTVHGHCVEFSTVETLADHSTLTFRYEGEVFGTTIEGTFEGVGPGSCRSEGSFTVGVTLNDDCAPNPCQNGGSCVDQPGGFTCNCRSGFFGPTCNNIDYCYTDPCENGGTCSNGADSFTCQCPPGYSGDTCEVDACVPSPCENGGVCSHGPVTFSCQCSPGWAGPTCADVDNCLPNPCLNGGTCHDGVDSFSCDCADGWAGPTCADVDNCYPNPCRNGTLCVDGVDTYTCQCGAAFTGTNCELDVDECAMGLDDCGTATVCLNTFGGFECQGGDDLDPETSVQEIGCAESATKGWPQVWGLVLVLIGARVLGRRRC